MPARTRIIALAAGLLLAAVSPGRVPAALAQPAAAGTPLPVVAAENFYGDIVRQVGGAHVAVTSILSNPDQDPHLFEASPSVARNLSAARLVVFNGIDYDPWMVKLLGAARNATREAIDVSALVGRKAGDNPHIWYDPATMLALARALADRLSAADPAHAADYARNLATFQASVVPVTDRIATLRTRLAGLPVTATEPVFGYMFDALGMTVRNMAFQLAVMNNTEPAASDVAAFENDLRTRAVRLLVYNSQASDPAAQRMQKLARAARVPVVGATETEPAGKTWQAWMLGELDAVDRAIPR